MQLRAPETVELTLDSIDSRVAAVSQAPAVFLLWPHAGAPYLAKTSRLGQRLARLLGARDRPSRFLNLRGIAGRLEYWLTGSSLEQSLISYELARRHFPDDYGRRLRLRSPSYVKLILTNAFPRTQVTSRLGGGNLHYGPFPTRAAAERFENTFLDLYQLRRCQEDLDPSPAHPGCIYGEMGKCLRPCQQVVTVEEYAGETHRVEEFLASSGRSLLDSVKSARDRLSEEMDFEGAARQHQRFQQAEEVLKLAGDLARDVRNLHGVAVTRSAAPDAVELWFLRSGSWLAPQRIDLRDQVSLDHRLREAVSKPEGEPLSARTKHEHMALLVRWYHSSWRDGEWLVMDSPVAAPYRRLVNAVHRVAARIS